MKKYKIDKNLIVQKLENKTIIFNGEESILYTLNETASLIFYKLKIGWNKEQIILELTKKYRIEHERVKKDINEFLIGLKINKIIKIY